MFLLQDANPTLTQEGADEALRGGLRLRAEVQVAPAAGLRPRQRLQGHLHGLVPLPVLLRVPLRAHFGTELPPPPPPAPHQPPATRPPHALDQPTRARSSGEASWRDHVCLESVSPIRRIRMLHVRCFYARTSEQCLKVTC
ncbi:Protein of unknown function [Gryllus bimaculatus]|nr:Protein of unknown function [Gryllus bimaculatus]